MNKPQGMHLPSIPSTKSLYCPTYIKDLKRIRFTWVRSLSLKCPWTFSSPQYTYYSISTILLSLLRHWSFYWAVVIRVDCIAVILVSWPRLRYRMGCSRHCLLWWLYFPWDIKSSFRPCSSGFFSLHHQLVLSLLEVILAQQLLLRSMGLDVSSEWRREIPDEKWDVFQEWLVRQKDSHA